MAVRLTVAIQAGGESSRMGQDKGLAAFLGAPMIARVVDRVEGIADEILVTTNRPEGYRFLGLPLFPDAFPGRGALGGLYTALQAASYPLVAVVACDLPFVHAGLLVVGRDILSSTQADIAIPQTRQGLEPFHAVYRRAACLPKAAEALTAGKWRADAWFDQVRLHPIGIEEIERLDPAGLAFYNVNTPDELIRAEALARRASAC